MIEREIDEAGRLTPDGALLLDPSGELESGIPFCPPEGDAGTGMTATNSVRVRSENVSLSSLSREDLMELLSISKLA